MRFSEAILIFSHFKSTIQAVIKSSMSFLFLLPRVKLEEGALMKHVYPCSIVGIMFTIIAVDTGLPTDVS